MAHAYVEPSNLRFLAPYQGSISAIARSAESKADQLRIPPRFFLRRAFAGYRASRGSRHTSSRLGSVQISALCVAPPYPTRCAARPTTGCQQALSTTKHRLRSRCICTSHQEPRGTSAPIPAIVTTQCRSCQPFSPRLIRMLPPNIAVKAATACSLRWTRRSRRAPYLNR